MDHELEKHHFRKYDGKLYFNTVERDVCVYGVRVHTSCGEYGNSETRVEKDV